MLGLWGTIVAERGEMDRPMHFVDYDDRSGNPHLTCICFKVCLHIQVTLS